MSTQAGDEDSYEMVEEVQDSEGIPRPKELASSVLPVLVPTVLFCFLVFGFNPILGQLVNEFECERLGDGDCNSEAVNKAAVRTEQFLLGIEYASATIAIGTVSGLSDYVGRKPLMAVSSLGQLSAVVLTLRAAVMKRASYSFAMSLLYVGNTLNGLTGSYGTFLMAVYAYGADVTRDKPGVRSKDFAKITGCVALGNTLGPLLSGVILKWHGYGASLVMHVCCGVVCLLVILWLKESQDPNDRPLEPFAPLRRHNTLAVLWRFLGPSSNHTLHRDLNDVSLDVGHHVHAQPCDDSHVVIHTGHNCREYVTRAATTPVHRASTERLLTLESCCSPSVRASSKRKAPSLLPLCAAFCLCFSDLVGVGVLFLYYAKRAFRWNADVLGYYESAVGATKAFGLFVVLPIIYRQLKGPPNDYLLAIAGMLCNVVYFLALALLPYGYLAFAVIPFTGLSQITYPHLRSLFSKAVPPDLQGQLFGLVSALETFSTAVTPWVVNQVYYSSPSNFPGLVWLLLAGFLGLAALSLYVSWLGTFPSVHDEKDGEESKASWVDVRQADAVRLCAEGGGAE